jgi:hypothetical protein
MFCNKFDTKCTNAVNNENTTYQLKLAKTIHKYKSLTLVLLVQSHNSADILYSIKALPNSHKSLYPNIHKSTPTLKLVLFLSHFSAGALGANMPPTTLGVMLDSLGRVANCCCRLFVNVIWVIVVGVMSSAPECVCCCCLLARGMLPVE